MVKKKNTNGCLLSLFVSALQERVQPILALFGNTLLGQPKETTRQLEVPLVERRNVTTRNL